MKMRVVHEHTIVKHCSGIMYSFVWTKYASSAALQCGAEDQSHFQSKFRVAELQIRARNRYDTTLLRVVLNNSDIKFAKKHIHDCVHSYSFTLIWIKHWCVCKCSIFVATAVCLLVICYALCKVVSSLSSFPPRTWTVSLLTCDICSCCCYCCHSLLSLC